MDAVLEALRALESIALDAMEDPDEETRSTAARALKEAAEARALVHMGDMRAVVAAMRAGVQVGRLSREHDVRAAALAAKIEGDLATVGVITDLYPTYSIGTRNVAGGRRGAAILRDKSGLTDAIIDKAMAHVHARDPDIVWTDAAEIVAEDWGHLHPKGTISGRTIRRRTSVKW